MAQLPPKLIVGLGNPGPEYSETRHNAGFWFCERLAREWGLGFNRESRFHGLVASSRTEGVQLLMPQTFMNRSGQAVGALARFYRIQPAEILVVHDELDIPPGQLRLKFGGGAGAQRPQGHHRSLRNARLLAAAHRHWPSRRSQRGQNFVLKPPRREEQDLIDESIDRAVGAWSLIGRGEWNAATTRLNARTTSAKPGNKKDA